MSDVEPGRAPEQPTGDARSPHTADGAAAPALAQPAARRSQSGAVLAARSRLADRPTIRLGAYAWAVVGVVGVLFILMTAVSRVSILAIPLVLALFPAAILTPLAMRLKDRGMRDALVATILVVGTVLIIGGIIGVLVPVVSSQADNIGVQVNRGVDELRAFLAQGPFGFDPIDLEEVIDQARQQIRSADVLSSGAVGSLAGQVGRFLTGLVAFVIALFFYLKDGPDMAAWLRRQFPHSVRDDASAIGGVVWTSIGSYFRGQLLVALIDALGIYIGLKILSVQLAEPVGVLVFFGSLFPVVGAFISGFVAVVIALALNGPVTALIVLGIVLGVQQLEGNVLQPLILGRATQLHPLAVVGSLIAGGTLLGILGAFLAVPVVASAWRAISYLRERVPG